MKVFESLDELIKEYGGDTNVYEYAEVKAGEIFKHQFGESITPDVDGAVWQLSRNNVHLCCAFVKDIVLE